MELNKEVFDKLYMQIPEENKQSLRHFMEYLILANLEEVDEPYNEEEKRQLSEPDEYLTAEEVKNEFKLHVDLP